MKRLVTIAAVVLICQAANIPPEVNTQQVSPDSSIKQSPAEVVAVADKKVSPIVEKTIILPVEEIKSKTQAIKTTSQPKVERMVTTVSDAVAKLETKPLLMPTQQPEMKTVEPTVTATEIKRKTRAIKAPVQPEVKAKMPVKAITEQSAVTPQPEVKTVMPTVDEMVRKISAMATTESVLKAQKPTVQVSPKTVIMSTMQPETKTLMPTVTEMKRKTRAVPATDYESKKGVYHSRHNEDDTLKAIWAPKERHFYNKMHLHRSMRSVKSEITTDVPAFNTFRPVAVKDNVMIKASERTAISKSTIDPCDLLCTKFEFEPICASNGLCSHEFPNQCILDTFNCKHAEGKFTATKDGSCQMSWQAKCEESDLI